MARLRSNNVFGTTTDTPLTAGATTLNSAGLANLIAVTGSDTAVITLDPNRVNGAPEIVTVTAHTGSATSATITRAAEGTSAREHPAGTFWVHTPTTTDWGTDWAAWTPTLANLTVGSGTLLADYSRSGNTVHYRFKFKFGSGSAVGTGPTFTLPAAPHASYVSQEDDALGVVSLLDSGSNLFVGSLRYDGSSVVQIFATLASGTHASIAQITATVPMTWATGDVINVFGTYRAA